MGGGGVVKKKEEDVDMGNMRFYFVLFYFILFCFVLILFFSFSFLELTVFPFYFDIIYYYFLLSFFFFRVTISNPIVEKAEEKPKTLSDRFSSGRKEFEF